MAVLARIPKADKARRLTNLALRSFEDAVSGLNEANLLLQEAAEAAVAEGHALRIQASEKFDLASEYEAQQVVNEGRIERLSALLGT